MADSADIGGGPADAGKISTARKVRLLLLTALLLALVATAGVLSLRDRAAQKRTQRELARDLDEMRQGIGSLDVSLAEAAYKRAKELDPGNLEADRLLVPLFLAAGGLQQAVTQFNQLTGSGAVQVPQGAAGDVPPALRAALLRLGPSRASMQPADVRYISDEGLLAGLAQRLTQGARSDRERAMLLCRWFALHVEPADPYPLPADPTLVIRRGFGSAQQTAWAYAEMARQLDLPCAVLVPSTGAPVRLVQVYPAGSAPFLLDPGRGVPVLEPSSRQTLSLASAGLAEGYGALLALAGEKADYGPEDFRTASLVRAIHPFALMPRFDAFDRLSSALPARPRLGYEPGPLPDGRQPSLWALPFLTFEAYASPGGAARVEEAHRWLTMVGKVGNMLLLQPNSQADAVLTELKEQIAKSLAQADAGTDAATLQGEAEVVSFWQAVNAHETGEHAQAAQLLKKYLDGYPQGRWRAIGAAMMADSLAQAGEPDAAQAAWREVPPGRRLYGAMRAAGLLPLAEPAAQ